MVEYLPVVEVTVLSPSKTRRARAKDELRQSILDAARTLALRDGWANVTTRKVAGAIDYTHPTIYEHFATKDALMAELNRVGYRELLTAMQAVRAENLPAGEALIELALAYCNFAWQRRELYEVMYGLSGVSLEEATYHDEAEAVIAEARGALLAWCGAERVQLANVDDAVMLMWSTLHGIASLALSRHMIGGKKRAARLATSAVQDLLSAWKATAKR